MTKLKGKFRQAEKTFFKKEREKRKERATKPILNSEKNIVKVQNININGNHFPRYEAQVLKSREMIVLEIECPLCGLKIKLHKHWGCFICKNHKKNMIFEVLVEE